MTRLFALKQLATVGAVVAFISLGLSLWALILHLNTVGSTGKGEFARDGDIKDLRDEIAVLEGTINAAVANITTLSANLDDANAAIASLQATVAALESEQDELGENITSLEDTSTANTDALQASIDALNIPKVPLLRDRTAVVCDSFGLTDDYGGSALKFGGSFMYGPEMATGYGEGGMGLVSTTPLGNDIEMCQFGTCKSLDTLYSSPGTLYRSALFAINQVWQRGMGGPVAGAPNVVLYFGTNDRIAWNTAEHYDRMVAGFETFVFVLRNINGIVLPQDGGYSALADFAPMILKDDGLDVTYEGLTGGTYAVVFFPALDAGGDNLTVFVNGAFQQSIAIRTYDGDMTHLNFTVPDGGSLRLAGGYAFALEVQAAADQLHVTMLVPALLNNPSDANQIAMRTNILSVCASSGHAPNCCVDTNDFVTGHRDSLHPDTFSAVELALELRAATFPPQSGFCDTTSAHPYATGFQS